MPLSIRAPITAVAASISIFAIALNTLSSYRTALTKEATMSTATTTELAPVIAIAHGAGPLPILGEASHAGLIASLKQRVPSILRLGSQRAPRAIALVTAHWVTDTPHVSAVANPKLLYDYFGFPPEAYTVRHDAPGAPDIAAEIADAMRAEGLKPVLDENRDWDHGVFVPMKLIDPAAKVPLVQVSILAEESPAEHLAIGRALGKLRASNVAIVASGSASLHGPIFVNASPAKTQELRAKSEAFTEALTAAVSLREPGARAAALEHWRDFPHADTTQPRDAGEHFSPLVVAAGAAGNEVVKSYADEWRGFEIYSYYWDGE